MYDSDGATGAGPANLEAQISAQPDMVFRRVCAGDIQSGVLKDFDVVIHPGGSGTGQGKNLGPTGLDAEKPSSREAAALSEFAAAIIWQARRTRGRWDAWMPTFWPGRIGFGVRRICRWN